MRKRVIFLVLLLMLVAIASAETKLSMELWNRWSYKMVDGENTKNELALHRAYFRLEPVFSTKIKGRFNLDFFSDDGAANGVGIKLKYGYLDFKDYLWTDATFTFGLMKNYFGTIYSWEYETIDKDPADKYKFASSTDYGMGISGYLPQGYGSYNVAVYNGEGYKKTGNDVDTNMEYLVNMRFVPVAGLEIGGSFVMNKNYIEDADKDEEITKLAGVARITMLPNIDLRAQYLTRIEKKDWDDSEKTVNAISFMPLIDLNGFSNIDMQLVFRYDIYDDNADMDDDDADSGAFDTIIAGLNYFIQRDSKNNPKLWIQANYQMTNMKAEGIENESEIMVQLRWKFSETMN
ncbi:MAG: hypothetical protein K9N07_07200 [Candidatus Cloacimonetes bacterium]|nr:hypothetical protein [Candidatus Cloacimonadota bacterium]